MQCKTGGPLGLWPYPQEVAFPPGHQPGPCPPGESWVFRGWRPALPVGTQEAGGCNARLISPLPRPGRHEVRAGEVMRVEGRRDTAEVRERPGVTGKAAAALSRWGWEANRAPGGPEQASRAGGGEKKKLKSAGGVWGEGNRDL